MNSKTMSIHGDMFRIKVMIIVLLLTAAFPLTHLAGDELSPRVLMEHAHVSTEDRSRAQFVDLMLNYYGVETEIAHPEYFSVETDYYPFCEVWNRNATDVTGVMVNCTIYLQGNGTPLLDLSKTTSITKNSIKKIEFDTWRPVEVGTYRLFFRAYFTGGAYTDPNLSNNNGSKYIKIEKRMDVSIESLDIHPEKDNYTQGNTIQVNITFRNHALTAVNFTVHGNITSGGAHIPFKHVENTYNLPRNGKAVMKFNHTFERVSVCNITAKVLLPENTNDVSSLFRLLNVLRTEPPDPVISKPHSNLIPSEDPIFYFSDLPLELDASRTWKDPNSTDLTYVWESGVEGWLSTKAVDVVLPKDQHGRDRDWTLGIHVITLKVSDGTYTRVTTTVIEIKERGSFIAELDGSIVEGEYIGGEDVSGDVSEMENPGIGNPPGTESMGLFRKISLSAAAMPESLRWLNVTLEFDDLMITTEETETDIYSVALYVFNEELVKWESMGTMGVDTKQRMTWLYLEEPAFTTKLGLFCKMRLKVAKISGTVYGLNPVTGERAPLQGAGVRLDRSKQTFTDEYGRYSYHFSYTKQFDMEVSQGGYTGFREEVYIERGSELKKNIFLRMKLGSVNGTLIDIDKRGIPGIEAFLIPKAGQVFIQLEERYIAVSNETGNFSFENVPIGNYKLIVPPTGRLLGLDINRIVVEFEQVVYLGNLTDLPPNDPPEIRLVPGTPTTGFINEDIRFVVEYRDAEGSPPFKFQLVDVTGPKALTLESSVENYTGWTKYYVYWDESMAGTYKLKVGVKDSIGVAAEPIIITIEIKEPTKADRGFQVQTWMIILAVIVLLLGLGVGALLYIRSGKEHYFCPECGEEVSVDDFECPDCGEELPEFTSEEDEEDYYEEDEMDEDFDSYTSITKN